MESKTGESRRALPRRLAALELFAAFLTATLLGQALITRSFASEFGFHPDEAAHYVTSLMIRDFLWSGSYTHYTHPMAFAQDFYDHYPKVALGNWPPVFYLIQAAWESVFGDGRISVLVLMSALSAAAAFLIFTLLRPSVGAVLAVGAAAAWSLLPLVMRYSGAVMTEIPIALCCLGALWAYARYLEDGRFFHSMAFSALASVAIHIKASAATLALVPPLAVALTGRWSLLRKASFWAPAAVVLVLCTPWIIVFRDQAREGWAESGASLDFFLKAVRYYPRSLAIEAGAGLSLLFGAGAVSLIRARGRAPAIFTVSLAFVCSVLAFHLLVPCGLESRHLIPALPHVAMVAALGLRSFAEAVRPGLTSRASFTSAALVLFAVLQAPQWINMPRKDFWGFAAPARQVIELAGGDTVRVLVSSESRGEGMFTAEMAARDERPRHTVRRGTKVLSNSTWSGAGYALTYHTTDEVDAYLDRDRIAYIVVDRTVHPSEHTPDMDLLAATLSAYPEKYCLLAKHPCARAGVISPEGILLYGR